jgi:hypothetical protein
VTDAVGDFLGTGMNQRRGASDLGVQLTIVFAPSAISSRPHKIFNLQVPFLVTAENDPVYFLDSNPLSPLPKTTVFTAAVGASPAFLDGKIIGISPASTASGVIPGTAPFTASFSDSDDDDGGPSTGLRSAVAAYLAVATSGETLVSARLPSP